MHVHPDATARRFIFPLGFDAMAEVALISGTSETIY